MNPITDPTVEPTTDPTHQPTLIPTIQPTSDPTMDPTTHPVSNITQFAVTFSAMDGDTHTAHIKVSIWWFGTMYTCTISSINLVPYATIICRDGLSSSTEPIIDDNLNPRYYIKVELIWPYVEGAKVMVGMDAINITTLDGFYNINTFCIC